MKDIVPEFVGEPLVEFVGELWGELSGDWSMVNLMGGGEEHL